MPLSMTKILITNIVVLNGGDGAILFGMLKILRLAFGEDAEVFVYASRPDVAKRMFPEIEFRETLGLAATRTPFQQVRYLGRICRVVQQSRYLLAAWGFARGLRFLALLLPRQQRLYLREYAQADLVVSSGGTYLKEEYGIVSQTTDYRITLALGRPLVFFTQSLGPFTRPGNRRAMRSIIDRASCVLLRDERSRANLADLGANDTPVHLAADAAFALADPATLAAAAHASANGRQRLRVCVSVRYWPHFSSCDSSEGMSRYRRSMAAAVGWLVQRGYEVTFLSTCQGNPEYADDAAEAEEVLRLLDDDTASAVRLVRRFVRYDQLAACLKDFDFCIGTRMHMGILSLISGTPVLPVAYEFKTEELFKELGLGEWVTHIETILPEGFTDRVRAFVNAVPGLRAELPRHILALHGKAVESGRLVRKALEEQA